MEDATKRMRDNVANSDKLEKILPLCYAGLSASIGGQSVMLAKLVAEVLKATIQGHKPPVWGFWDFYLIVVILVVCLINQMAYLNDGLRRYDVLILVPIYQCLWIFFNILGGAIFYDEFSCFGTLQAIFFPFGALLTWLGIYVLMRGRKVNEEVDDAPPEESAIRGIDAVRRMTLQHDDFVMQSQKTLLCDDNVDIAGVVDSEKVQVELTAV